MPTRSIAMAVQQIASPAASSVVQEPLPISGAIAAIQESAEVPQDVAVRDNSRSTPSTRIGVGNLVKARAHLLLGPERANVLYNELGTSAWEYGQII